MGRVALDEAYPGLAFRPQTRNWWAWLTGQAPECVHLERDPSWSATLVPDTLYVRGKSSPVREPARPEVSLCRGCLLDVIEPELALYAGRVVAFEPQFETLSQYFFVASPDFDAAGLEDAVAAAIGKRLDEKTRICERCARRATWLWLPRDTVGTLDDVARIESAAGHFLCATHGAEALCRSLKSSDEANVFYFNLPYGEAGAYVWI